MELVISPALIYPPALSSLSQPWLRSSSRQLYCCCSAAKRRTGICRTAKFQGLEFKEKSAAAQEQSSSSSRRQFVALLLSSSGSLPLAQLLGFGSGNTAVAADVNGPLPAEGADELEENKTSQGTIIGDLFGFDGLGKTPDEYVLGKVVAMAQAGDGAVLFLGVDGFELPLQLVVGPAEAMAVLTAVQERKTRRPVTHEAWGLSLAAVGWKVDRVVITGNEKDVFYSSVVLSNLSQLLSNSSTVKKSVDMRPSDGIALALRCRAPLFVRRKVAEEILGRNEDMARETKVDPLKQPGLKANAGIPPVYIENIEASPDEREPDFTVYSSWMRRLQSL